MSGGGKVRGSEGLTDAHAGGSRRCRNETPKLETKKAASSLKALFPIPHLVRQPVRRSVG